MSKQGMVWVVDIHYHNCYDGVVSWGMAKFKNVSITLASMIFFFSVWIFWISSQQWFLWLRKNLKRIPYEPGINNQISLAFSGPRVGPKHHGDQSFLGFCVVDSWTGEAGTKLATSRRPTTCCGPTTCCQLACNKSSASRRPTTCRELGSLEGVCPRGGGAGWKAESCPPTICW